MNVDHKIMQLISRILESDSKRKNDKQPRILPALRLSVVLLCILLCALSRNAIFVVGILAAELLRLAFLPAPRIAGVLKRLALPVLFTLLIMLPSVFLGHPRTMLTITMKVTCSVLLLLLANEELDWRDMTGVFRSWHVPGVFTMTLDMTMRFLVMLGRYANAMLEAISLRTLNTLKGRRRDRARYQTAGGVLGTTFLVSQRMAQETYEAMECRGYDGDYRSLAKHRFGAMDALYAILIPVLLIVFFYAQHAMQ